MKLKKLILKELSENENSKIFVVNESGDPLYVIIPFRTYAHFRYARRSESFQKQNNLTNEQILDKINQELAQWHERQNPTEMEESLFGQLHPNIQDEEQDQLYLETIDE
jgi:hypothetical protein